MISPVCGISGYRVQAIYGNPISMQRIRPVKEESNANSALVMLSKDDNVNQKEEINPKFDDSKYSSNLIDPIHCASGGYGEIEKQLDFMNKSLKESTQRGDFYQDILTQMGNSQVIRDKVNLMNVL